MGSRSIVLLLALFSLFPGALALEVLDAHLEWNGHEVVTLSPEKSLPGVLLAFTLSEDFSSCWEGTACSIVLDSQDLSFTRQRLDIQESCKKDNTTIECKTGEFTLTAPNGSLSFREFAQAGGARSEVREHSIPILLDETPPVLTSITTGHCDEERCYAAANVPTPLTVEFSDSVTSFHFELVFVGQAGRASQWAIDSCSGSRCMGTLILQCADGEDAMIEVKDLAGVASREDAQNEVGRSQGTRVVCKNAPPQITDWQVQADGIAGQAVSGGTLTVVAAIEDEIGSLQGIARSSGILNGTDEVEAACTQESCAWTFTGLLPGVHEVQFEVRNALGGYATRTEKIVVLDLLPAGEHDIDAFAAAAGTPSPERLNRMAIELARANSLPYPLHVPYALSPKRAGVEVVRQELKGCAYKLPNGTNYSEEYSLFAFGGEQPESHAMSQEGKLANRLDLSIRADPEILALSDTFNVRCEIALTIKEGNALYSEPQAVEVEFDVGLRETVLGQPGESFVSKIRAEEESLSGDAEEFLMTLREVRATMDGVCTTFEALQGLSGLLTGLETTALAARDSCAATLGISCGPAQAFLEAMGTQRSAVQGTEESVWYGAGQFMRKMCYQVNCRGDVLGVTQKIIEKQSEIVEPLCKASVSTRSGPRGEDEQAGLRDSLCSGIAVPSTEDSFFMSALSYCAGGMIYNAGKWQDIDCGYLQCLKEQSLNGASTAVCENAKEYKTCTFWSGEAFELGGSMVINVAENAQGIIEQSPLHLASWLSNAFCTKSNFATSHTWAQNACHWVKVSLDMIDYADATRKGFSEPFTDNSICLEALCNPDDEGCKLSYNKLEQFTQYTEYLQINTWFTDQRKRTGATPQKRTRTNELFAKLDAEWLDHCADLRCGPEGYHIGYSIPERSERIIYTLESNDGSEKTPMPQGLYSDFESLVHDPDLVATAEDYETFKDAVGTGVHPRSKEELEAYRQGVERAEKDPEYSAHLESMRKIARLERLEAKRERLVEKRAERLEQGKPLEGINGHINAVKEDQESLRAELEEEGYAWSPDGGERWTSTLTGSAEELAGKDPSLVGALGLEQQGDAYTCGGVCRARFADAQARGECGPEGCRIGSIIVKEGDGGELTIKRDISKGVESGEYLTSERKELTKLQRTILSVGIQILRDQGYLDWLSISHWGDWGIDLVGKTKTYLTKDGWTHNLCNSKLYDVDDGAAGTIYLDSQAFPEPVGTFAVERRTWEEGPAEERYLYLMTILISNPEREMPQGVNEDAWTERNTYTVDARFTGLAEGSCTASECPQGDYDLIEGTRTLEYGGAIASGEGPLSLMLSLPAQYERVCVTFDKPFPDGEGRQEYCRAIKEDAYERGSPVPREAVPAGSASAAPPPPQQGEGCFAGALGGAC